VYAPQALPVPAPIAMRLIGVLDEDLVEAFTTLERDLLRADGGTMIVDVRDLDVHGEAGITALVAAVRRARVEGRDVRIDARNVSWRRVAKKEFSGIPPIDAQLRADVRRTTIVAHSGRRRAR
jgi:anti-anti-sigma regulatory factor